MGNQQLVQYYGRAGRPVFAVFIKWVPWTKQFQLIASYYYAGRKTIFRGRKSIDFPEVNSSKGFS